MKIRTVQEFVEDLIIDGRTHKEVICVAQSTRWEPHLEEVKKVLKNF